MNFVCWRTASRVGFVVSHPFHKEREKDGARRIPRKKQKRESNKTSDLTNWRFGAAFAALASCKLASTARFIHRGRKRPWGTYTISENALSQSSDPSAGPGARRGFDCVSVAPPVRQTLVDSTEECLVLADPFAALLPPSPLARLRRFFSLDSRSAPRLPRLRAPICGCNRRWRSSRKARPTVWPSKATDNCARDQGLPNC